MLDRPEAASQPSGAVRRYRAPARAASDASEASPIDGAAFLAILRRRKWLLLASIVLCPLLCAIAISQLTPRYTATGSLLYDASEYKLREMQSILRVDPVTDAVMASQAEVLRGIPVVEQVASRLNLHANPEFNIGSGRRRGRDGCSPRSIGPLCRGVLRRPGSCRDPRWSLHAMPRCRRCRPR